MDTRTIRALVVAGTFTAVAAAGTAIAAAATGTLGSGCTSYQAVGTSTAVVALPARQRAFNYVATVMADDVPGGLYPQSPGVSTDNLQVQFSLMMNPARYNNNDGIGGAIAAWSTLNHVPARADQAIVTATAVDAGGVVRLAIVACPTATSGTH